MKQEEIFDRLALDSNWPVAEAKARLSEVLRRARTEGPQRIGEKEPCIVISQAEWQRLTSQRPPLGQWLVEELAGSGELELPTRRDLGRAVPFAEEA